MKLLRAQFRRRPLGYSVAVIVCLALFALISTVQVAHLHQSANDADHCAICVVMHSAAPITMAAVLMVLVQVGVSTPIVKVQTPTRSWYIQLFTRPPPYNR